INPALGTSAVPALAQRLWDRDLDVRLTAAAALEGYGPFAASAAPAMAQAVAQGDPEFRRAVMYALQTVGPDAARVAIPNLIAGLKNQDGRVRRTAAETLGHLG